MPSTSTQDNVSVAGRTRRKPSGLAMRRGLLVPIMVLVAALALAACGSSSSSAPAASSSTTAPHATGKGGGTGGGTGGGAGGGSSSSSAPATGKGGGAGGGAGGGLAKGVTVTVQSASATQLRVTIKAGITKTVVIGSSTTITQNGQTVSASAIKAGQTLLVKGSRNSAGQIVATSIAIQ